MVKINLKNVVDPPHNSLKIKQTQTWAKLCFDNNRIFEKKKIDVTEH